MSGGVRPWARAGLIVVPFRSSHRSLIGLPLSGVVVLPLVLACVVVPPEGEADVAGRDPRLVRPVAIKGPDGVPVRLPPPATGFARDSAPAIAFP